MSVLKLAQGLWEELETHRKSSDLIQEEMVRRADEILSGGMVSAPTIGELVRQALERKREKTGRPEKEAPTP